MNLAIHIILALSVVALAVCLFIVVKIVGDLESIIYRMDRRIDEIKKMNEEQMVKSFASGFEPVRTTMTFQLVDEKDDPLDFPNDSAKEGRK